MKGWKMVICFDGFDVDVEKRTFVFNVYGVNIEEAKVELDKRVKRTVGNAEYEVISYYEM
jgi:hypothetical protein